MSIKVSNYEMFACIIESWKPRCKKIKKRIKDLALEADLKPCNLSKIISGKFVENPRVKTINKIEMAMRRLEDKAGVKNEK